MTYEKTATSPDPTQALRKVLQHINHITDEAFIPLDEDIMRSILIHVGISVAAKVVKTNIDGATLTQLKEHLDVVSMARDDHNLLHELDEASEPEPEPEPALAKKKYVTSCSRCGKPGHNKRTCGRQKKSWPVETKMKAVERNIYGGERICDIADDIGVGRKLLGDWKRQ